MQLRAKMPELHFSARIHRFSGSLTLGLVVLGLVTGMATFLILTGLTTIRPTEPIVENLLYSNVALVSMMGIIVIWQMVQLLRERAKGTPGAGMHLRLIGLFSLIATTPALLVAIFASVTLNRGLDSWFEERTRNIVETASSVADAYIQNTAEATRVDLASIASDLNQQFSLFTSDRTTYVRRVARHAAVRKLAGAFVFESKAKRVEANATLNDNIKFFAPEPEYLEAAERGEALIIQPRRGSNIVRGLVKLQGYPDHYLYVYRLISPTVIDQVQRTREAKAEYDRLAEQRLGVQLTYGSLFALIALVFLLSAIFAGLRFADRIVAPIVLLLNAAREVARGNFDAKVEALQGPGDLRTLSRTFNLMTDQVKLHRDQLVATNEQLDERRRFSEAMLSGVSAGVIGVNPDFKVSILNRSATTLLGHSDQDMLGKYLHESVPEFVPLFELALSRPSGSAEGQIALNVQGRETNFVVRITTERSDDAEHGHVITFDDITELVSAQRNSAWSDIARRIAHEIKNPLTPIQLSAERLKRKYLKEITTDRAVFEQCTDTIIRQVGDLGRIVDEFSSFARMPKAIPEPHDLADVVKDATVLQRVSAGELNIEVSEVTSIPIFPFDRRLVTQAITNLVKNARESIEGRQAQGDKSPGNISVEFGLSGEEPFVSVTDNGMGLPQENRHRLAEPYMTTREKGTGLGLAIVKRIMEEHGGALVLTDAPQGQGARVTLRFARLAQDTKQTA